MPAINFKKQFAEDVESGKKHQTIRAKRKDGRNIRPGERLYLYTGQRTKGCRKLGESICASVQQITIDDYGINCDGQWLSRPEREAMAIADGFNSFFELKKFFEREHGLPFEGLLYKW